MLYIVATPIGNLQDITFRAIETLKGVNKIYCEDTRRTRQLLQAFQIDKPLESYHHHSDYKIPGIVRELKGGQTLAYVSDAGTPGIADPAGKLVAAVRDADIDVVPIPGPSAVTAILSVAGILANAYEFVGYVPTKKGRQTFIRRILIQDTPVVFFETAPRLVKFFNEIIQNDGGTRIFVVGRELTKTFEDIRVGNAEELKAHFEAHPPKGELVLTLTVD